MNSTESLEKKHESREHIEKEENKLVALRREKLAEIRQKNKVAFPNDFAQVDWMQQLQQSFNEFSKEQLEAQGNKAQVAGRIMFNRGAFMVVQDMTGQIQLYVNRQTLSAEKLSEIKTWDLGDIVGAKGVVHKSNKGDLYIDLEEVVLLTKSLRPLPEKFKGLSDTEICYRQRYLDLMVNKTTRETFIMRSKVIDAIRSFLKERHFLEVETPMMQAIPGGAAARPFMTHHNALDMSLYLRIAPELYLKRLVVGGFDRVFEINRNFRNEGVSTRHNPEFTMLEFYQAYATYHELMDLTEQMLRQVTEEVLGQSIVSYQGDTYDFGKPFDRMSVFDAILKFNPQFSSDELSVLETAKELALGLGISVKDSWGLGKIQIEIFEKTVEHQLKHPTFITAYPTEVSPLARRNDENPFVTDRFEFFVGGREIANGFSELNDAEDQAARFKAQVEAKEGGDIEAMHYDADYITALEYGLPPTAGEGIGIDRLVMLFADAPSIRDVILFPHMRHQG